MHYREKILSNLCFIFPWPCSDISACALQTFKFNANNSFCFRWLYLRLNGTSCFLRLAFVECSTPSRDRLVMHLTIVNCVRFLNHLHSLKYAKYPHVIHLNTSSPVSVWTTNTVLLACLSIYICWHLFNNVTTGLRQHCASSPCWCKKVF